MKSHDEKVADVAGRLGAAAFFIGLLAVLYNWSSCERRTADRNSEHGALWFYASDVAPGDVLDGHIKLYDWGGVAITGVVIKGALHEQAVGEPSWTELETEVLEDGRSSDEFAFRFRVPSDTTPGGVLHVDIDVGYATTGGATKYDGFSRTPLSVRFRVDVPIYSSTASALRRAGKAVLALVSWVVVIIFVVGLRRWHVRRDRSVNLAWAILIVPHAVLGWFWFSTLVEHATRLHGWWIVGLCLVVWYLAFVVVYLLTFRDRNLHYIVVQARLPLAEGDAYRGAGGSVPSIDIHVLEEIWRAAGSVVERTRDELLVTHHRGRARVPLPSSERFGAGEPFAIRCNHEVTALELIEAAATVLGELRWTLASQGLEGRTDLALS